ncbi:hypothetical protein [Maritimibacter sp. UBA3975]|uniref:hypothetical protein n=1 Tax=Maritimibacter sp. UBA3975 TaxID=1946833 RepID=UPI000C0B1372|nr:hypothetical protein [Maritimibacter sp. UBA3975]MAM60871.1 hypothetical protein [Maritimibacter sp.]|tara:strand:+ start:22767 stop:23303 length:537 start_codon:yes stop_codon:yes gene_type:complete
MEIHGYTQSGSIDATINGKRMSVPDAPGNRHRRMIAEWEAEGNTIPPFALSLNEAKAEARATMLAALKEAEAPYLAGYSNGEPYSWDRKAREADAIAGGETDPAKFPVIAAEAQALGVTPADVAAVVQTKATLFAAISGALSGIRQKWGAAIDAATDQDDLDAAATACQAALTAALST